MSGGRWDCASVYLKKHKFVVCKIKRAQRLFILFFGTVEKPKNLTKHYFILSYKLKQYGLFLQAKKGLLEGLFDGLLEGLFLVGLLEGPFVGLP